MKKFRHISILWAVIVMLSIITLYTGYKYNALKKRYMLDVVHKGVRSKIYRPSIQKKYSKIRASYIIGAYNPSNGYNCFQYNSSKTMAFLNSLPNEFEEGEIIEVDNLKWKMTDGRWLAHKNPPGPFDTNGHPTNFHLYAQWINDHPHLGFPPLPLPKLSASSKPSMNLSL